MQDIIDAVEKEKDNRFHKSWVKLRFQAQLRLKEDEIVEKRSLIFGYVFPRAHNQINSQQG